jgi:small subunit ribosomal protein S4e
MIMKERQVQVDGKVRTDMNYPAGFMDVVTIPKTGENFRLLYDVKGRYTVHKIKDAEAKFKLCKVTQAFVGQRGVPVIVTHDARTIRYPDPHIKAYDTVKVNIESGKVEEFYKFETGKIAMITGGRNLGRVGIIQHRERQHGGFDIVTLRDSMGQDFATRLKNVFVIGEESAAVTLPKGKGVKLTIAEERDRRFKQRIGA